MKIIIHQAQALRGDFEDSFGQVQKCISEKSSTLHLFPEMFLCGYPLQDLCLQQIFISAYQKKLVELSTWCEEQKPNQSAVLVGGLDYSMDEKGNLSKIENVIFLVRTGAKIEKIYTKKLLPTYDIFDERKYFTPGEKNQNSLLEFGDKKIGLMICEDMWASRSYEEDPLRTLFEKHAGQLDFVINLSASPYDVYKHSKRISRAMEISNYLSCPFVYVNQVSAEDEILFDGQSFIVSDNQVILQAPIFEAKNIAYEMNSNENKNPSSYPENSQNSWESLFKARLNTHNLPHATLTPLTHQECMEAIRAICFGVQEYAKKSGFKKFVVAVSGGIDSALVLALLRLGLKDLQQIEAIYMPSIHSSAQSYDLSKDLCDRLGIPLHYFPIKFIHSVMQNNFSENLRSPLVGLTDENIQSRLRGLILMTRSNQTGAMVVNTSNKSELAVGYSTLYGDSVGAISIIGDLYKSEVYQLSKTINQSFGLLIPDEIIQREPTAELRDNQKDSDSLPAYSKLDPLLEALLSFDLDLLELNRLGFDDQTVSKVRKLLHVSEFKRKQFCPILKLKPKSFGFGYRVPITKASLL